MSPDKLRPIFLQQFAPETWTPLHKLRAFLGSPLPDDPNVRIGLRDCEGHLSKVSVCWRILEKLRGNLAIDRLELDRFGGTNAHNSQEFAVVCETMVTAMYSAIDGLRIFFYGAYRNIQGIQRGSNGKLFERAKEAKYGVGFPEEIRILLSDAHDTWFPGLRAFRTELTHGAVGSCHLDEQTHRIRYMNDGIRRANGILVFEDIEAYLLEAETNVRSLVDAVAQFHFDRLEPIPHFAVCGVYLGRLYVRMVPPSSNVTFNDGFCMSYDWFEKEPSHQCPLSGSCGAYARKWPAGTSNISGPAS